MANGTSMTDPKRLAKIANPCKRGDVIAWAERHVYTYSNSSSQSEITYVIGLVESVTRDGIVKTANTGMGISPVSFTIDSAAVAKDRIDHDKAWAWLSSSANYPRAGSTPLRSMDEVRAIVRQWLTA
jgi:hypothetical protein